MNIADFIQQYLTTSLFTKLIEQKKPTRSVIFERVFGTRSQKGTAYINIHEIADGAKSVPVIRRGGQAFPVSGRGGSVNLIEPMAIRLSDFISAAKLNDLRALYGDGSERGQSLVQAEIDRMINGLMRRTEMTRNALCAQAITGKIDYQMASGGGFERYEVEYGTPHSHTISKKWDADATKLSDIVKDLTTMTQQIAKAGYAGTVEFLIGTDVFGALINKINGLPQGERMGAVIRQDGIDMLGYTFYLVNGTYADRSATGADVVKPEIDPKTIIGWADGYSELIYCAVDDIEGNLEPSPFFAKSFESKDPSGVNVISESKPLPVLAAQAFVKAIAVS